MTRALRRRLMRISGGLDVPVLTADAAAALLEAGMVDIRRLSDAQLEAIADGAEWDFSGLTDAELGRIAAGEAVPPTRTSRTGKR